MNESRFEGIEDFIMPGYFKKLRILEFFRQRSYKILVNYHQVNESDMVESIFSIERHYRKQGYLVGFVFSYITWDTVLKKILPISKIALGIILMKGLAEINIYRHIDEIHDPLWYVYDTYYAEQLGDVHKKI